MPDQERIRKLLKDLQDTTRDAHRVAQEVRAGLRKARTSDEPVHRPSKAKSAGAPRRKKR